MNVCVNFIKLPGLAPTRTHTHTVEGKKMINSAKGKEFFFLFVFLVCFPPFDLFKWGLAQKKDEMATGLKSL